MINHELYDTRLLTRSELATVVIHMRTERRWSQATLAELAQISERTIQRLEDGKPSSLDTRRAVANAFELGDLDYFDRAWPIPNIEKFKAEQERMERETVAVAVQPLTSGKALRELADIGDSALITTTTPLGDAVDRTMAELQEYFMDYGDCHGLYRPTEKLEIDRAFQVYVDELTTADVTLVAGRRKVVMRSAGESSLPLTIVYVVATPKDAAPTTIRVPRNDLFGF